MGLKFGARAVDIWLQLASRLLATMLVQGRSRDCDEHVTYIAEGLDEGFQIVCTSVHHHHDDY